MYEHTGRVTAPHTHSAELAGWHATDRLFWYAAAVVFGGYLALFAWCSPLALQDLPNHLARTSVMADLMFHHGARFGSEFELQYRYLLVPYAFGDLLLTAAVELAGPQFASALWMSLAFLSLPAAVLYYLRTSGVARDFQLIGVLLAAYLSIDYSFTMGFLEFRLGIAFMLVALALGGKLRDRPSARLYCLYAGVLAVGYLVHLTAVAFLAAALAVTGALRLMRRTTSVRLELYLFAPIAVILGWHFGVAAHFHRASDMPLTAYTWRASRKTHTLVRSFIRYGGPSDRVLPFALLVCIGLMLRGRLERAALARRAFHELLALAATFLALFVVFPFAYEDASYVDLRALSAAVLFLLLACFALLPRDGVGRQGPAIAATVVALMMAVLNLAYISRQFARVGAWADGYRSLVALIPRGARVLPVTTVGSRAPYLHAGSTIVFDRAGIIPYLFSANNGGPMVYFRYRHLPYVPDERWYLNQDVDIPASVDWKQIGCAYRFLLVTRPYEAARIGVKTTKAAENTEATLLAIDPSPCPHEPPQRPAELQPLRLH
jgi:hypothetical protein